MRNVDKGLGGYGKKERERVCVRVVMDYCG